ncbi:MAG: glycosyltransferase family 39 protein [Candidatus Woesebacteria bacterium]|jgi:hypothetical protein
MKKITKNFKQNLGLIIILTFSLAVGLYQLQKPMIANSDAYMHSLVAYRSYFYDPHYVWLPGYNYLIHSLVLILPQSLRFLKIIRVFSLIFSLLTIIFSYLLAKRIFKKNSIANITALLVASLPMFVFMFTQSFQEVVFIPLFLAAIYFLMAKKSPFLSLTLSLLLLNLAHSIRYESWFVLPLLWLYLILKKNISKKLKIYFVLASLVVPIVMSLVFYKYNHSLLFLQEFRQKQQQGYEEILGPISSKGNLSQSMIKFSEFYTSVFDLAYIALAILSFLLIAKRNKKTYLLFFLPLLLLALQFWSFFNGSNVDPHDRYFLIPAIIQMPFVALVLNKIIKAKPFFSKASILNFLILLPLSTLVYVNQYQKSKVKHYQHELIGIRDNIEQLIVVGKGVQEHVINESYYAFFPVDQNNYHVGKAIEYFSDRVQIPMPREQLNPDDVFAKGVNIAVLETEGEIEADYLNSLQMEMDLLDQNIGQRSYYTFIMK